MPARNGGFVVTSFIFQSAAYRPLLEKQLRGVRVAVGVIGPLVAIIDLVVLLFAMELVRRLYLHSSSDGFAYLGLGAVVGLTYILCSRIWNLNEYSRLLSPRTSFVHIGLAVLLGVGVAVLILFLLKVHTLYSRGVLAGFTLLAPCLIGIERVTIARLLEFGAAEGLILGRRVVLIGESGELQRLPHGEIFGPGSKEVFRLALSLSSGNVALTNQNRSAIQQAIMVARSSRASEYALIIPWSFERCIGEVSDMLRYSPRRVRLYPDHRTRATLSPKGSMLSSKGSKRFDASFFAEIQPEPLTFADRCAGRCRARCAGGRLGLGGSSAASGDHGRGRGVHGHERSCWFHGRARQVVFVSNFAPSR